MLNLLNLTHDIESSQTKTVLTSVVKISCPLKRYELSIVGFDWVIPQRPMQPEGSLSFFLTEGRTVHHPFGWCSTNPPGFFTFQGPILHAKIWFYSRNHAAFVVLHSDGKIMLIENRDTSHPVQIHGMIYLKAYMNGRCLWVSCRYIYHTSMLRDMAEHVPVPVFSGHRFGTATDLDARTSICTLSSKVSGT